jgi:hypothetical protein
MPFRRTPTQAGSTCLKRRTTKTNLHQVSLDSQPTEPQQRTTKKAKGPVTATAQEQLLIPDRLRTPVVSAENSIC